MCPMKIGEDRGEGAHGRLEKPPCAGHRLWPSGLPSTQHHFVLTTALHCSSPFHGGDLSLVESHHPTRAYTATHMVGPSLYQTYLSLELKVSGWSSCSALSALSLWHGLATASQLAQPFALLLASGAPVAFGPSFLARPSGLELEICSPGEVQATPYVGHWWGQRLCQPPGQGPMELVTLPGVTRSTGSHHPGARGCGCSGLLCSAMLLVQALHSTDAETESKGGR